ncbi:unnamed protein product [Polarella glacialis]|uniref:Oxidation resistance protein 1 n=1 Tax=Polarella glacialis TaxID=89957 RepID=A0A813KAE3_POLGL|nr:unnamed protein product [Polarella glacialis]
MGNVLTEALRDITEEGDTWRQEDISLPHWSEVCQGEEPALTFPRGDVPGPQPPDSDISVPSLFLAPLAEEESAAAEESEAWPYQVAQVVLQSCGRASLATGERRRTRWQPLEHCQALSGGRLLLTKERLRELRLHLPLKMLFASSWQLLYCPRVHGVSIRTFFRQCQAWPGETLMLVEDTGGRVFGGFASHTWQVQAARHLHVGLPECFVFSFGSPKDDPDSLSVHAWAGGNQYFMFASLDGLSMGGGKSRALWIDKDFLLGSSVPCATFGTTAPLASSAEFVLRSFEQRLREQACEALRFEAWKKAESYLRRGLALPLLQQLQRDALPSCTGEMPGAACQLLEALAAELLPAWGLIEHAGGRTEVVDYLPCCGKGGLLLAEEGCDHKGLRAVLDVLIEDGGEEGEESFIGPLRTLHCGPWPPSAFPASNAAGGWDLSLPLGAALQSWTEVTACGLALLAASLSLETSLPASPPAVLLLGVGTGALASFLGRHAPQVRVDVVEPSQARLRLCQQHFGLQTSKGGGDTSVRACQVLHDIPSSGGAACPTSQSGAISASYDAIVALGPPAHDSAGTLDLQRLRGLLRPQGLFILAASEDPSAQDRERCQDHWVEVIEVVELDWADSFGRRCAPSESSPGQTENSRCQADNSLCPADNCSITCRSSSAGVDSNNNINSSKINSNSHNNNKHNNNDNNDNNTTGRPCSRSDQPVLLLAGNRLPSLTSVEWFDRMLRHKGTGAVRSGGPDPAETSRNTAVVMEKAALSPLEVSALHALAARARREGLGREVRSAPVSEAWEVLFLQDQGFFEAAVPGLLQRFTLLAKQTASQQGWLQGPVELDELRVRVVEYHRQVAPGPGIPDPRHYDLDSLVTIDVLLSEQRSDFSGGTLQTLEASGQLLEHSASLGDALIFASHKFHCVQPVSQGVRRVLVLEFWRGPARRCPHRCRCLAASCPLESEKGVDDRSEAASGRDAPGMPLGLRLPFRLGSSSSSTCEASDASSACARRASSASACTSACVSAAAPHRHILPTGPPARRDSNSCEGGLGNCNAGTSAPPRRVRLFWSQHGDDAP